VRRGAYWEKGMTMKNGDPPVRRGTYWGRKKSGSDESDPLSWFFWFVVTL
jgi:hypothetical protein